MTEAQKEQVFRYIVSRDITVEISIEIFDHMSTQICLLMEKETDFDAAFEKVKETWHNDLKINPDLIFAYSKSKLNFRMKWNLLLPILRKSAVTGSVATVFAYGVSFITGHKFMLYFSVSLVVIFMLYHFISNFKFIRAWTRLRKKYDRYALSVYDEGSVIIITATLIPQLFFHTASISEDFKLNTAHSIIYVVMLLFVFSSSVFAFLSLRKLKASSERIQMFVKYLHPNRFYAD